ncbi:MAG TPA: AMP-binding protein, partial [Blastocatellia bacterium]|nr:AMP-binding protein [Blastocatellia bacterium]
GVSVASVCHVAWGQVVARTSGREEVVYGTVLLGRMQGGEGAERAMGLFMNTLPVKVRVGEEGAAASVRGMQEQLGELLRHEQASLALAQRCSGVAAPTPLFTSLLNYRHSAERRPARSVEQARVGQGMQRLHGDERNNYPLTLSIDDVGEEFWLYVHVDASVGSERVCRYMHRALESLVEALDSQPAKPLRTLEVMPEAERQQAIYEWNATKADYPRDRCVHELFEQQVEQTPEAMAVVCGEARLTYGELNRRANQLAHYLRQLGVGPDARVAICADRGVEMMLAVLAVFKAGAAYVPLDPQYPAERLRYMLEDSAPVVLLTQGRWRSLLPPLDERVAVIDLDAPAPAWPPLPISNPTPDGVGSRRLAYLIYTSGSTGQPKGVMVEQRGMINHLYAKLADLQLRQTDVVAQTASPSFDISVWQMLAGLLVGGQVQIVEARQAHDPQQLWLALQAAGVTVWETVPSLLEAMLGEVGDRQAGVASLRWVLVTGEACAVGLWRR